MRRILEAGDVKQQDLASDVGISKAALSLYLSLRPGGRTASESTVYALNEALAKRLSDRRIADYLNATYWLEKGDADQILFHPPEAPRGNSHPRGSAFPFLQAIVGGYGYLRVDPAAVAERLRIYNALPRATRRAITLEVNAMHRRRLLRQLLADGAPSSSEFEDFRSICARHDLNLKRWLRDEDELAILKARDDFFRTVQDALSKVTSPADRLAAERAIRDAFGKVDAAYQRLSKIVTHKHRKTEKGKRL
ncbi:MAG TPA: helix-turn-helix transcriptional regulator [Candidatus Cybelea sp.]|nr:helix-turn-helix transcriptional regulator [Candidatus Cybelea sp.]